MKIYFTMTINKVQEQSLKIGPKLTSLYFYYSPVNYVGYSAVDHQTFCAGTKWERHSCYIIRGTIKLWNWTICFILDIRIFFSNIYFFIFHLCCVRRKVKRTYSFSPVLVIESSIMQNKYLNPRDLTKWIPFSTTTYISL